MGEASDAIPECRDRKRSDEGRGYFSLRRGRISDTSVEEGTERVRVLKGANEDTSTVNMVVVMKVTLEWLCHDS